MNKLPCGYLEVRLHVSAIAVACDSLYGNDSIGTGWQHRARHDLYALTWG